MHLYNMNCGRHNCNHKPWVCNWSSISAFKLVIVTHEPMLTNLYCMHIFRTIAPIVSSARDALASSSSSADRAHPHELYGRVGRCVAIQQKRWVSIRIARARAHWVTTPRRHVIIINTVLPLLGRLQNLAHSLRKCPSSAISARARA